MSFGSFLARSQEAQRTASVRAVRAVKVWRGMVVLPGLGMEFTRRPRGRGGVKLLGARVRLPIAHGSAEGAGLRGWPRAFRSARRW